jgi:transcriptional regulator with XRE-family HTH domain
MGTRTQTLRAFGIAVRKRRVALNLSQEKLAEKSGSHRNYIGAVERGERNPTLTKLYAIAQALDVDPGALLRRVGKDG